MTPQAISIPSTRAQVLIPSRVVARVGKTCRAIIRHRIAFMGRCFIRTPLAIKPRAKDLADLGALKRRRSSCSRRRELIMQATSWRQMLILPIGKDPVVLKITIHMAAINRVRTPLPILALYTGVSSCRPKIKMEGGLRSRARRPPNRRTVRRTRPLDRRLRKIMRMRRGISSGP